MRTIGIIKNVAGALLVTITTALALTACHPDDDIDGTGGTDGDMITVSRLEVGIEAIGSTGTRAGDAADTRAGDAAGTRAADASTRTEGTYAGVKTEFVDGDVLHICAEAGGNKKYATATYRASEADGTPGSWSISPALMLPKDGASTLEIFYDGGTQEYGSESATAKFSEVLADVTTGNSDGIRSDPATDVLYAHSSKIAGSVSVANGALTIKLRHANAFIRLGKVENNLTGRNIVAVAAVVCDYRNDDNGGSSTLEKTILLNQASGGSGDFGTEAFSYTNGGVGNPYVLTSFVVTISDGNGNTGGDEKLIIPVPDATGGVIKDFDGKAVTGQPVLSGKKYTYHLVLAPGKLTATLDGNSIPSWNDKGQLVTAPDGYIPIYSAEELKKIGVKDENNSENYKYTYTYTDASGTEKSLPYSLDGKYILMAEIDLGNAAVTKDGGDENWTPIGKTGDGNQFTGRFNGNGHTITRMRVNTSESHAGFFGVIDGAVIYNLHFEGASVTNTSTYVGTLAGYATGSSIALCSATDCMVSNKSFSGGLMGYSSNTHLTRCYAINCTVTSGYNDMSNSYAGGLVGRNDSGSGSSSGSSITAACYTAGCTVAVATNMPSSSGYAGGLVGNNTYSSGNNTLYGCYALYAAVTATGNKHYLGALAGYLNSGNIISCYATSNNSSTGGSASNMLVGGIYEGGTFTITDCISPLKDPGDDGTPSETLIGSGYGITYRDADAGYALLVKNSDNSDIADCDNVRTVIVNTSGNINVTEPGSSSSVTIPLGGIYVVSRTWKAAGIWKIDLTDADKQKNAPFINWSYDGE